jgi:hypothetical protein
MSDMPRAVHSRLSGLVDDLRRDLGDNLLSVVLYGPAARDGSVEETSSLYLLVVVAGDSLPALEPAARTQRTWVKAGNHPLLFVTPRWIEGASDVFPVEFLDMMDHRRVLTGRDPLAEVAVSKANLRHQCEHELRSIVLRLRAAWLDVHDDARGLHELLTGSFGSVTAVTRGALRLAGHEVPPRTEDLLDRAASRFGLDAGALHAAAALKKSGRAGSLETMRRIFLGYFSQVEALGQALDTLQPGPD